MLDYSALIDLEDAFRTELKENLTGIITTLNRTGQLEELLDLLGLSRLLQDDNSYHTLKSGTIIVIGQSDVGADVLAAVAKKCGIDKKRIEFYTEYEDAKTFNFGKTQWNPNYSLIMVGPMPHSTESKGDYSSVISAIENEEGYPPVIRMGKNTLKITKSDFREKLENAIKDQLIA